MKRILFVAGSVLFLLVLTTPASAQSTPPEITTYTTNTLSLITTIAIAAAVFFLVKGGYLYMSSSGNPDALENAKSTIKNALIGLVLVLAAGFIVTFLSHTLGSPPTNNTTSAVNITPIDTVQPPSGLTVILTDAISGLLQMVIVSGAKPVMNGVIGFLTSTPTLLSNAVIVKFWLIMLGITDSLFAVVVAILGLHFMSASTFGFEEVELKTLLPKIGLAFLGANVSLFLADYVIVTCNTLVSAILNSTGGLSQALLLDAVNPVASITHTTPFITLIFLMIFLILSILLLFMYIGRLIFISLYAVLSPLVFLAWCLPKFSSFAEIAVKTYLVTVFTIFVHVVVIQLASAFLTLPSATNNSIVAIAVGIGLFFVLLKIPQTLMRLVFYTSGVRSLTKLGGRLVNILTTDKTENIDQSTDVVIEQGLIRKVRQPLGV